MKTFAKLVTLLAVLVICIPAQGEILIYNKILKGFAAEGEGVTNPNNQSIVNWNWLAGKRADKGFLILDVEFDTNSHISEINDAIQIEYWKDGLEKGYEQISHNFDIERMEVDNTTYWVLRDITAPAEDQISIFMVEGEVKMSNIGLSSKVDRRESPLKLTGTVLTFVYDQDEYLHYIYEEILTVSLRLNQKWTRLANSYWEIYNPSIDYYDPFEWAVGGIDNNGEPYGIVEEWLIQRGYVVVDQSHEIIDNGSQDNNGSVDDSNDYDNQDGIIWFP